MKRRASKRTAAYVGLLAAAFAAAMLASWAFGRPLDNAAYDYWFRLYQPRPWQTQSAILEIDEASLVKLGGMRHIRKPLADGLRLVAAARPAAVAVDVILTDEGDAAEDRALEEAFRETPNLALVSLFQGDPVRWEDPKPEFGRWAKAIGHAYAQPDESDSVTRSIPLEMRAARDRRWALALEAFRLSRGQPITESVSLAAGGSASEIQVGDVAIPVIPSGGNVAAGALMRIRYLPPGRGVPSVALADLLARPALAARFAGKVVFAGVTAPSMLDRLFTPYAGGQTISGIRIHADAFETMAQRMFLPDVPMVWTFLFSLALAIAAGLAFRYLPGWWAYAGGGAVVATAMVTPYVFFAHQRVLPFASPVFSAWLAALAAASFYHLVVRRDWRTEQSARERYQQAMHFVTHEMRTPLSAIQGSSEMISRYALPEEKRKQIALLINSESKRLARMVEIFLNVERLTAGHMELKHETIPVAEMVEACIARVRPLAERKHIAIELEPIPAGLEIAGDRELMEYACYNLLTNAVKYSPQRSTVTVAGWRDHGHIRIAVRDQGIGLDQKEAKQIFQKFYRTRKAEESGEAGTGIGLSIVQQIVEQHGGAIEVVSQPGEGSCFTLALPAAASAASATAAERH
jgi:signal transduction histidine kinase